MLNKCVEYASKMEAFSTTHEVFEFRKRDYCCHKKTDAFSKRTQPKKSSILHVKLNLKKERGK